MTQHTSVLSHKFARSKERVVRAEGPIQCSLGRSPRSQSVRTFGALKARLKAPPRKPALLEARFQRWKPLRIAFLGLRPRSLCGRTILKASDRNMLGIAAPAPPY